MKPQKLIVKEAWAPDVYRDHIRVYEKQRIDDCGKIIKEGSICEISVEENSNKILAILRGNEKDSERDSVIRIDNYLRQELGVEEGSKYGFIFRKVGFFGQLRWALNSTEPGYRISAYIAIVSLLISILSLLPFILKILTRLVSCIIK